MVSSRLTISFVLSVLLAVVSAHYHGPSYDDKKPVCFKKIEKCCYKFHKCGYKTKKVADKKKCVRKECKKKCVKVPYTAKVKQCKQVKVEVKCKQDPQAKKGYGYYTYDKKPCYEYKKQCSYKYVTKYKQHCKDVCVDKYDYITVYKEYKYAQLCPKLECKQQPLHYPNKPEKKVSKKGIYVGTKGECKKKNKYVPYL